LNRLFNVRPCTINNFIISTALKTFALIKPTFGKSSYKFAHSSIGVLYEIVVLKLLLTILLFSTGLRIVAGGSLIPFYSASEQVGFDDEEDEKETPEKKQNKKMNDETFPLSDLAAQRQSNSEGNSKIPLQHQKPYSRFIDQPNTPPPNNLFTPCFILSIS